MVGITALGAILLFANKFSQTGKTTIRSHLSALSSEG